MSHCQLNTTTRTVAAVDDILQRGKMDDWKAWRTAVLGDLFVIDKVAQMAQQNRADSYQQWHPFWNNDVKLHRKDHEIEWVAI